MNKIILYLLIINISTFIIFGIDKYVAIKNKQRVRERTLIGLSLIGGSLGGIISMNVFRHKTLKALFKYGLPLILFLQIIIVYFIMIS